MSNEELRLRLKAFENIGKNNVWNEGDLADIAHLVDECIERYAQFDDYEMMLSHYTKPDSGPSPNENPAFSLMQAMLKKDFCMTEAGFENLRASTCVRAACVELYKLTKKEETQKI